MRPRVSVIVLAHNYGRFLSRCLDSVLGQPFQDIEIIVVDDGSTDDTPDVVKPYLERGVRYVRKENGGVTSAVNAGIDASSGEYFALISADDEWTDERLVEPVRILDENPHVGLVYTDLEIIDASGAVLAPSYFAHHDVVPRSGDLVPTLFVNNIVPGGTLLCRMALKPLWHPIPEVLKAEDWFIAFRVACEHVIEYVPVKGIRYRKHGQNMNLGQQDRTPLEIDDLLSRRWMLAHPIVDRLAPFVFAPALIAFAQSSPRLIAALPVTDVQRHEAHVMTTQAVDLFRDRNLTACLRVLARAVAADPSNEQAVRLAVVAWQTLVHRQAGLEDVEARTFKPLAFASELLADTQLLQEYASAFGGQDDATLLVQTLPGDDLEALVAEVERLGSDADMVAITEPDSNLAAVADCLLTRGFPEGLLSVLRAVSTAAELQSMHARTTCYAEASLA